MALFNFFQKSDKPYKDGSAIFVYELLFCDNIDLHKKIRISFLVSDGLYFGEGPINDLFKDQLAAPALLATTRLMQYLTEKVLAPNLNKSG